MKKILLTILLLLSITGCNKIADENSFGAELSTTTKINIEKSSINTIQSTELLNKGSYKYVEKYEKDNIEYSVPHEWKKPDGSAGYQYIINDGKTIESTCVGVDCDGKVYKREIFINSTSTSKIDEPIIKFKPEMVREE